MRNLIMNKRKLLSRILIVCLVFALLVPLLAACGKEEKKEEKPNKGNTAVTDSALKPFEELDFKDEEITISLSKYTWAQIPLESWQYIQGPDRVGSDSVLNLVYERNQNVQNAVNILPTYVYTSIDCMDVAEDVNKHVMMPSHDTPDLYIDQVYGMVRAQMQGNFANLLTKEEASHFDFGDDKTKNQNGWYNAYMNGFNFASDEKMYMLAGDYFMDVIRMLNLTAVNLTDFEAYFLKGNPQKSELGVGKDYLYNTVETGGWTIDQMIEWSNVAYKDLNNNSRVDKEDRLGVLAFNEGPSSMGILPSADVSLYKMSEDGRSYSVGASQTAVKAIDAWQKVFSSRGAYVTNKYEGSNGYADLTAAFVNGNVLFSTGMQLFQLETAELKAMEDEKCLIPYPKVTEKDEYYVFTHDNARVGAILKCTTKFEAVSAWVQASSVTSGKVLDEYYNTALKYKNSVDYGSTKMLDIVYENIKNPKYIVDTAILTVTNNAFMSDDQNPTHHDRVVEDKTNTYTSKYQSAYSRLEVALKSYKGIFADLK